MKKYLLLYGLIMFSVLLFLSCGRTRENHIIGNSTIKPKGVTYTYKLYGSGSSQFKGALLFIVHSNNGLSAGEYYELNLKGNVIYTFPPDTTQLLIPNMWPGYYNFTVTIGCSSGRNATNSDCYLRSLNGTSHAKAQITSVMDVYL